MTIFMMNLWIFNHAKYIWFKTTHMLLISIKIGTFFY